MSYYNPRPKTEEEKAAAAAAYEAQRAAEQKALEAKREEYQDIALDIAIYLSCTWEGSGQQAETNHFLSDWSIGRQELKTADGHTIILRFNDHDAKNRVKVWGEYPDYLNGTTIHTDAEKPAITCSLTRSPLQIANDIQTRFMPKFAAALEEANRKKQDDIKRVEWTKDKARCLINRFGCYIQQGSPDRYNADLIKDDNIIMSHQKLYEIRISARSKSVSLDRVVPTDEKTAFEIMEIVTGYHPGTARAYRSHAPQGWRQRKQQPARPAARPTGPARYALQSV